MADHKIEEITSELVNLNLDDLDVEELERRLEMSVGSPNVNEPSCDVHGGPGPVPCGANCNTDGCDTNCGVDIY